VHVTSIGGRRNVYRFLIRKPEGKRPFRRPRRRWENNIGMNFHEIRWDGRLDWGHVRGTSGGLLQRHSRTFESHKMQGISCLVVELIASQERTCFKQLVSWLIS